LNRRRADHIVADLPPRSWQRHTPDLARKVRGSMVLTYVKATVPLVMVIT
jgi:hypothetical protein